jgi:RND family efflux transporter MFP subunit
MQKLLGNLGLIISTGIAASGCGQSGSSAGGDAKDASPQRVVVTAASELEITDYLVLVARMAADKSVKVQSRVSGFLEKIHFTDGQRVAEDGLLFSIEPDAYEAIYNQSLAQITVAETRLDFAEKQQGRSVELMKNNAISREEYEQNLAAFAEAKANLVAAKADADRVKLNVNYTKILSPISGRVDRALIDEGNFVTGGLAGGTTLTTVLSEQPIKAVANVDEGVRLKFMRRQRQSAGEDFKESDKVGDLQWPCYLQLQDESDFPHEGLLEYVEIQVDQQTGTSRLRANFENKDGLLKVGMFVRLKIPVSGPYTAVLIPDTAIGTDQATKFVYIVNDQMKIEQRTVELGDTQGAMRVVKVGVEAGEQVVVSGLQLVQPGMAVATK